MPFLAPVVGAIGTALSGITTFLSSGTILAGVAKLGLSLAAQYAVGSLLKKKASTQTTHLETQYGEDLPRTVVLGKRALAGHHVYRNSYGKGGRTIQDVYVLSHFRINGVPRVRYKGEWKTLKTTEAQYPERGFQIDTGDDAKIWIKIYQGALDQAADADLIAKANPAGRWTIDHRLAGLAYAFVTSQLDQKNLTDPWDAFFEVEGLCYDWRFDDTAGGEGSHRWSDPTTWAPSLNPIVQAYNLERGFYLGDQLMVGKGADTSRLPIANWTLAANIADETVFVNGVGGPRYTSSYIASAGEGITHSDNMEPILAAAAASWINAPGVEYPLAGATQAVVATIVDDDLLVDEDERVSLKRTRSELVNTIAGTYAGPDAFYDNVPLATRTDADAFAADRERLAASVPYDAVIDPVVGDRLNDIALRASRYQANADICLRQKFLELQVGQWISWTSSKAGGFNKTFQIVKRKLGPIGDKACRAVYVTLQEVGDGIFDPTAYTTNPPDTVVPGAPDYQSELVNFAVSGVTGEASTGSKRAGIRATWTAIEDPTIVAVDLEYGPIQESGDTPSATASSSQNDPTATEIDLWQGVMSQALYAVRYRLRSTPPRVFFWSSWFEVTTDDARLGSKDIYPITSGQADQVLKGVLSFIGDQAKAALQAAQSLSSLVADHVSTAYDNVQQIQTVLTSEYQNADAKVTAAYTQAILVATGPDSSIAQQLTTLTAQLGSKAESSAVTLLQATVTQQGDDIQANSQAITQTNATVGNISASNLLRAYSTASVGGSSSTIALAATATAGAGNPATAAIYLLAMSDGTSRLALIANQTMIMDAAGNISAMFQAGTAYLNSTVIGVATIQSPKLYEMEFEDLAEAA